MTIGRSPRTPSIPSIKRASWRVDLGINGQFGVNLPIEVQGFEHTETSSSMTNLASTYREQGKWKEAEELEHRVLEIRT